MSKTLIVVMALALVLVGGSLFSARADSNPSPTVDPSTHSGCVSCQVKKDRGLTAVHKSSQPKNDWQRDEMDGPVSPY